MVVVHFYENKTRILTQYLDNVPAEGSDIRIKGRNGKVTGIETEDNRVFNVQVAFKAVAKNKQPAAAPQNKKKR